MTVWLEELGRGREVRSRHRLDTAAFSLGRAYDNDIVLDDPHVAPHHLQVWRDQDGRWRARDLGTHNGLWTQTPARRVTEAPLDGEHPVRIGNTWLRLRSPTDPVVPEQPLRAHLDTLLALALTVMALLVTLLPQWLRDTGKPEPEAYLGSGFGLLLLCASWITGWALVNRIFARHAQFQRHAVVALAAVTALGLIGLLLGVAGYALSMPDLPGLTTTLSWLGLGVAVLAHLLLVSPRHQLAKGLGVAAMLAVGLGYQGFSQQQNRDEHSPQAVLEELLPPALRLVEPEPLQQFLSELPALEAGLAEARDAALRERDEEAGRERPAGHEEESVSPAPAD